MPKPCHDFDLAPLRSFPTEVLLGGRNSADAFVLVLATAFNDLKGLMWWIQQLQNCRPEAFQVDPYTGQWQGMHVQCKRYIAAILYELLVAIDAANEAHLLDDLTFKDCIERSGPDAKRPWADLVAVAIAGKDDSALRKVLHTARNRAAFHYDRTRLWGAYEAYFVKSQRTPYNEAPLVSLGDKMERTRFYVADAAADHASGFYDEDPLRFDEVNQHVKGMNQALRMIVEQYLLLRSA
jgi:hypothetical protein